MVYTAQSAALAALEMLVHLGKGSILSAYVLIPCSFPEALVTHVDRGPLPMNWRSHRAPPQLQLLGNEWLKRVTSAVLEVPGVIIEAESNYLLNPVHADFELVNHRSSAAIRI